MHAPSQPVGNKSPTEETSPEPLYRYRTGANAGRNRYAEPVVRYVAWGVFLYTKLGRKFERLDGRDRGDMKRALRGLKTRVRTRSVDYFYISAGELDSYTNNGFWFTIFLALSSIAGGATVTCWVGAMTPNLPPVLAAEASTAKWLLAVFSIICLLVAVRFGLLQHKIKCKVKR